VWYTDNARERRKPSKKAKKKKVWIDKKNTNNAKKKKVWIDKKNTNDVRKR